MCTGATGSPESANPGRRSAGNELGGLKKQREGLAAKVDKAILKKYEKIVKSKDGLAVVAIVNEVCQGCFRTLPPQVTNEVKMNDELVFCDSCARILYIEE